MVHTIHRDEMIDCRRFAVRCHGESLTASLRLSRVPTFRRYREKWAVFPEELSTILGSEFSSEHEGNTYRRTAGHPVQKRDKVSEIEVPYHRGDKNAGKQPEASSLGR